MSLDVRCDFLLEIAYRQTVCPTVGFLACAFQIEQRGEAAAVSTHNQRAAWLQNLAIGGGWRTKPQKRALILMT